MLTDNEEELWTISSVNRSKEATIRPAEDTWCSVQTAKSAARKGKLSSRTHRPQAQLFVALRYCKMRRSYVVIRCSIFSHGELYEPMRPHPHQIEGTILLANLISQRVLASPLAGS